MPAAVRLPGGLFIARSDCYSAQRGNVVFSAARCKSSHVARRTPYGLLHVATPRAGSCQNVVAVRACCSARQESSTHLCSVCVVMTWFFFFLPLQQDNMLCHVPEQHATRLWHVP